jgi:hypothetical protein
LPAAGGENRRDAEQPDWRMEPVHRRQLWGVRNAHSPARSDRPAGNLACVLATCSEKATLALLKGDLGACNAAVLLRVRVFWSLNPRKVTQRL